MRDALRSRAAVGVTSSWESSLLVVGINAAASLATVLRATAAASRTARGASASVASATKTVGRRSIAARRPGAPSVAVDGLEGLRAWSGAAALERSEDGRGLRTQRRRWASAPPRTRGVEDPEEEPDALTAAQEEAGVDASRSPPRAFRRSIKLIPQACRIDDLIPVHRSPDGSRVALTRSTAEQVRPGEAGQERIRARAPWSGVQAKVIGTARGRHHATSCARTGYEGREGLLTTCARRPIIRIPMLISARSASQPTRRRIAWVTSTRAAVDGVVDTAKGDRRGLAKMPHCCGGTTYSGQSGAINAIPQRAAAGEARTSGSCWRTWKSRWSSTHYGARFRICRYGEESGRIKANAPRDGAATSLARVRSLPVNRHRDA